MVKFFVPSVGKAPDHSEMQKSPHYQNGKFLNIIPTRSADFGQVPRIMREYINRKTEKAPNADYIFKETNRDLLTADSPETIHLQLARSRCYFNGTQWQVYFAGPHVRRKSIPFQLLRSKTL